MNTDKQELAVFLRALADEVENDEYYEVMFDTFNHFSFKSYDNTPSDYVQDLGKSITIRLSPKRVTL